MRLGSGFRLFFSIDVHEYLKGVGFNLESDVCGTMLAKIGRILQRWPRWVKLCL